MLDIPHDPPVPEWLSVEAGEDCLVCRLTATGRVGDDAGPALAVQIGHTRLGVVRPRPGPDGDVFAESDALFEIPSAALVSFVRLSEHVGLPALQLSLDGATDLSASVPMDLPGKAGVRLPALFGRTGAGGLTLADLWLASDAQLRLRFEDAAPEADDEVLSLAAYQVAGRSPTVREVGRCDLARGGPALCTLGLANPLWPVLLVISDATQTIHAIDLVPFPSLLRGGLHHWELRASAVAADDMRDVANLSATYLHAFLRSRRHDARRIDAIRIDASDATGTETLFTGAVLDWLARLMRVEVRLDRRPADDDLAVHLADHLAEQTASLLPPAEEGRRRGGSLLLPADAIPTLHALVSALDDGSPTDEPAPVDPGPCAFIVQPRFSKGAVWSVCLPWRPGLSEAVQPIDRACGFPHLSTGRATPSNGGIARTRPIAIRQTDLLTMADPARLFPRGSASPAVLTGQGEPFSGSISICLLLEDVSDTLAPLVDSLRFQSARPTEIVVVGTAPRLDGLPAATQHVLRALFPDAVRYLAHDPSATRGMALAEAAERASGEVLVFVSPGMVLHDRRTLDALATMATMEGIASAGAMLLRALGERLGFCGAGYFLTGLSFSSAPALAYEALPTDEALAMTTYPVVANASLLMASRKRVFQEIGGFAPDYELRSHCDIEFGLRAVQAGYLNLCTTALTAISGEAMVPGMLDVDLLGLFPRLDLQRLVGATTTLRRLT
ncbi:glycosyltransferase family 2 protein [Methylobacterium tarhaniae]|uniref:glycosyltransferase family 2 protein n=2 Tax=Methylobacterium tarhaniae TaxID=1187852 RepID=UPI003D03B660